MSPRPAIAVAASFALVVACSSSSSDSAASTIKCMKLGNADCLCDTRATSPEARAEISCKPADIATPSVCCGEKSFAASKEGGCECGGFLCSDSADGCFCSGHGGGAIPGATPPPQVDKCVAKAGRECCLDKSGDRCSCGFTIGLCAGQGTVVPDCTVARLETTTCKNFGTFSEKVAACN